MSAAAAAAASSAARRVASTPRVEAENEAESLPSIPVLSSLVPPLPLRLRTCCTAYCMHPQHCKAYPAITATTAPAHCAAASVAPGSSSPVSDVKCSGEQTHALRKSPTCATAYLQPPAQ
jgi:hypothetical protein